MKLKELLTTFKRTASQLVRHYDINPAEFLKEKMTARNVKKSIEDMRREAERQRIAREVKRREALEEQKRATENAYAIMEIDNILVMLQNLADMRETVLGRQEVQDSVDTIKRMIEDSLKTWNDPVFTVRILREWMVKNDRSLEKLATAIYDDESYNTNARFYHRDQPGDYGRNLYRADMSRLAKDLRVPLPNLYYVHDDYTY